MLQKTSAQENSCILSSTPMAVKAYAQRMSNSVTISKPSVSINLAKWGLSNVYQIALR